MIAPVYPTNQANRRQDSPLFIVLRMSLVMKLGCFFKNCVEIAILVAVAIEINFQEKLC